MSALSAFLDDDAPPQYDLLLVRNRAWQRHATFSGSVAGQTLRLLVKARATMIAGGRRVPTPDEGALLTLTSANPSAITVDADGLGATLSLAADALADPAAFPEGRALVWSLQLVEAGQDLAAGTFLVRTLA